MKKNLFILLLVLAVGVGLVWAGTVSIQPYGQSFPSWYGYSGGAATAYKLGFPTLTGDDTAVGAAATQTLTNKTLTAPVVSSPAITGGTATNIALVDFAPTVVTVTGAIPADVSYVELNTAAGKIEATIAAPAAGRFLVITQIDTGTDGHTVTLTAGVFDASNNDIATFDAAGETLILFGVSATRFIIIENIGSVGLSGA
jgi:hypothetical protein